MFHISFWSGKTFKLKKIVKVFRNWITSSKSLCTTHCCSFKIKCRPICHADTSVSLTCESKSLAPHLGSPGHSPGEQSRGPYPQVFPRAVLSRQCPEGFLVPTVQNLWRKTLDMRFKKGANKCLLLGNSNFCPQLSMALLSLAQSNQCADYCTTALSWTGSLNTGATEQDLQKLPSMYLKSSPVFGKKGLHSASPPEFCCPDWDSRAVISSLDVAHLLQTGELAMNLGPGKGGGLGWRVHIWDDVTLGRFGYALCRWRDR